MMPIRNLVLAMSLLGLSLAGRSGADVLLTTDGRLLDGAARLGDDGSLGFVQRTGPNVTLDFGQLLLLTTPRPSRLECGVVLTSGWSVAAKSIVELRGNGLVVTLANDSRVVIPLSGVSTIVFRAAKADLPAAVGVLLASGDFFEGEIVSLTGQSVVVSSNLFGERTFEVGKDVVAARLRTQSPARGASVWCIRHTDGSVSLPATVQLKRQRLEFSDSFAVRTAVPLENIAEIQSPLATTVPLELSPAGGPLPSGLQGRLRGVAPWADRLNGAQPLTLAVSGNGGVAAELAGAYSAVFVRVGWPVGHLEGRSFRVAVMLDGVRVLRTATQSPLSDALMLAIPCTGKQKLEIRIEVEGGGKAEAVFDAPMAVKVAPRG